MNSIAEISKENNKLSELLIKENLKIYTDFVCYLRVSNLGEVEQEEIINDVLLMFLEWQQEEKSIETMVGGNLKNFADSIIAAINPQKTTFEKIKEILAIIIECFCFMLTIDFIFVYSYKVLKGNINIAYNYNLAMFLRFILFGGLAYYVVTYICKNSFEFSKTTTYSKVANFIFGAIISALVIFTIVISKQLSSVILFSLNIIYVIVIVGVYWIYKVINKFLVKK